MNNIKKITKESYEIIVSADGKDTTPQIMSRLMKTYKNLKFVYSENRLGKGGGIEHGFELSRGDKIIFMDVDLSVDPSYTKTIISMLKDFDIVAASRYNPISKTSRSKIRAFLGFGFSILARIVLGIEIRDTKCGFKGFKREVLEKATKNVMDKGWFWDTELLFIACRMGYKICEFPVPWYERKESNVHILDNIFEMLTATIKLYFRSLKKGAF